jgi:hypothetical protein
MKLTKFFILAGICTLMSCKNEKKEAYISTDSQRLNSSFDLPDSLSSKRVTFALNLKSKVAKRCWPSFGKKRTEGTLIYFNQDQSEVFFPSSKVLKKIEDYNIYSDDYVVASRTDSIPFHMEVMISFDSLDSSEFFFEHPVEQFLSVEETGDYIPSVKSTEMWATMVVHEMFHHFQYNNENFVEYAESVIGILPFDIRNLVDLCHEDEHFLTLIQNENKILLKAISEGDKDVRDSLILSYLNGREQRITRYGAETPNLERIENYYVIQEGSARYIEYHSMFILNSYFKNSDAPKIPGDPKFNSYSEFEEIDLGNNVFNYLIYAGPTDYHYTLGFNLMRLLDELKIEYKKDILNNPEKGLHQYLEDYLNTLPSKSQTTLKHSHK